MPYPMECIVSPLLQTKKMQVIIFVARSQAGAMQCKEGKCQKMSWALVFEARETLEQRTIQVTWRKSSYIGTHVREKLQGGFCFFFDNSLLIISQISYMHSLGALQSLYLEQRENQYLHTLHWTQIRNSSLDPTLG